MGLYWLDQKQARKALAEFRRAEALDASVDQLYYYIGTAELAAGNKAGACDAWQRGERAGDERARQERVAQCR